MGDRTTRYRLEMDAKGVTAAAKEVREQWTNAIQGMTAGAGGLGQIVAAAGPAGVALAAVGGAAVVAGMKLASFLGDATSGAVALGGKLSDMSTQARTSAEDLQKLGAAFKLVGKSQEDVVSAINAAQKQLTKAPQEVAKLGMEVDKLKRLDGAGLFLALSDGVKKFTKDNSEGAAAMAAFGKGGQQHMAAILGDMRAAGREAENLGQVLGGPVVSKMDRLGDRVNVLSATWDGFKNQLGATIATTPGVVEGVNAVIKVLGQLSQWVIRNRDDMQRWITTTAQWLGMMGRMAVVLAPMASGAHAMGQELGGTIGRGFGGGGLTSSSRAMTELSGRAFGGGMSAEDLAKIDKKRAQWQQNFHDLQITIAQSDDDGTKRMEAFWDDQTKRAGEYGRWYLNQLNERRAREKGIAEEWRKEQEQNFEIALALNERLTDGLVSVAEGFQDLGGAAGGALGEVFNLGGGLVGVIANVNDFAVQSRSNLQKIGASISAVASIITSTRREISTDKAVATGAVQGAAAGAQFGVWGAVVGGIGGAVLGYFSGNEFRQSARIGSHVLGQEVTQALGDAIASTMEQLGVDARTAGLLNINMAMSGRTGPQSFTSQMRELLGLSSQGGQVGGAAMQAFGQAFTQLVDSTMRDGPFGRALTNMVVAVRESGQKIAEVEAFVSQQFDRVGAGAVGLVDTFEVRTEADAKALGGVFSVAFWQTVKERGIIAASNVFREAFHRMVESIRAAGGTIPSGFGQMGRLLDLGQNEAFVKLAEAARFATEALEGLGNLGFLDTEVFGDLGHIITTTFDRLTQLEGVTDKDALGTLMPSIVSYFSAAQQFGLPIDPKMQEMLDRALEAGFRLPVSIAQQQLYVQGQIRDAILGIRRLDSGHSDRPGGSGSGGAFPDGGTDGGGGEGIPTSPAPFDPSTMGGFLGAAIGFGPRIVPNLGRGLGPLIQTHAGEGVLIVPRAHTKRGGFFGAADGFGAPWKVPLDGAVTLKDKADSIAGYLAEQVAATVQGTQAAATASLQRDVKTLLGRAPSVEMPISLQLDTTGLGRNNAENFLDELEERLAQSVRAGRGELLRAFEDRGFGRT